MSDVNLDDIPHMTPEQQGAVNRWLSQGAPKKGEAATAGQGDPTWGDVAYQAGRGALRGVAGDVAGLYNTAGSYAGLKTPKTIQDWIDKPDESNWETAGKATGEYAPLVGMEFIPGLQPEATAGLAARAGYGMAKGAIGGATTGDPTSAVLGGAFGGASPLVRRAGSAALHRIPAPVRYLGDKALTIGGITGVETMMRGHDERSGPYVPWWYIGHSLPSALSALAALALGLPSGVQGRLGAEAVKGMNSGEEGQ